MKDEGYRKHKNNKEQKKQRPALLKKMVVRFFCTFVITIVVLSAVFLRKLYSVTASSDISVCLQGETLSITWDTPFKMDAYRLFAYDEETKKYVSCGAYQNGTIMIDAVEEEMKLRLQSVKYIKLWNQKIAIPCFSRKLTVNPKEITKIELQMSVNPENKTVFINWQGDRDCSYEVYFSDSYGERQLYSKTDNHTVTLDFSNELAMPNRSTPALVAVRAVRRKTNYMLYSPMSDNAVITRVDLLENKLSLCETQVEERQYLLSWQECHGDWYEVQQWSEEKKQWMSKCTLDWTQELTYATEHLPSNTQVHFRVITYNNEKERNREEFKADPSEIAFHTGMSPLYCTIWPIVPLKIVDKPQGETILGEVPAGQALCVLEETDGYFKISYKDCFGYLDSRFCMINLPEYMGDLCMYDITNSISSLFRVHGYIIPEITNNVVKGYENVCLSNGDYIVPYLYPCTAKLYQAALSASADGYRLCIYDAFRPNEATRYLYDTVETIINEPVIEEMEECEASEDCNVTEETEADRESEDFEEAMQMSESDAVPETVQTEVMQSDVPNIGAGEEPLEEASFEEAYDTYWSVMTDNRFRLSSFLAAVVSTHNRGIALDLTLVDVNTREALLMQSDMHDLSWYSIIAQNNENARLLAKYMKDAGYHDLSSEWWHFQDDETRNAIGLNSYLAKGVSIEGWKKDDTGWRYRLKNGGYYKNKTVSIDGREFIFDAEGYCIEGELVY